MNTNKTYMVVQIGCIECGVSSYPVGIYDTLEEAEKVRGAHPSTWKVKVEMVMLKFGL